MPSKSVFAAALSLCWSSTVYAQLPPGVFPGEPHYNLAPAGSYGIDPSHTAVLAKVWHIGYSKSVFRFDTVTGTLKWDPAKPSASSLEVTVETASIDTPVTGFAKELTGPGFLNSAAFPKAVFVSTSFRQIDETHGEVKGRFTLLGRTAPATFNVSLLGAGKGFMGHPRIGVEATTDLKSGDFGLPGMLGPTISMVIDAEFIRN